MNSMLRRLALAAALTVGARAVLAYAEGGGDLVVFDWSGYEDPLLHPDYAAKYGADAQSTAEIDMVNTSINVNAARMCSRVMDRF